jgi:hypothetical protein
MQAFLNELSFPHFDSTQRAKDLFNSLGLLYKTVSEVGIKSIRIRASFFQQEFAAEYTFGTWINDGSTDSDLRTLLMDILTTPPYVDDIFKRYEESNDKVLEFYHNAKQCYGLGLASDLVYDTLAFSYDNGEWMANSYGINLKSLQVDDEGEFLEEELHANTRNVTTGRHLESHTPFIQDKLKLIILNGEELWRLKSTMFPNLEFCDKVEGQVNGLDQSTPEFQQLLNRLFDLQNFASTWDGSPIKPTDFKTKITPESASRLRKFEKQLTIQCPDGVSRLFSWHARYTPGAGRVHFRPLQDELKILIGSVANQNSIK